MQDTSDAKPRLTEDFLHYYPVYTIIQLQYLPKVIKSGTDVLVCQAVLCLRGSGRRLADVALSLLLLHSLGKVGLHCNQMTCVLRTKQLDGTFYSHDRVAGRAKPVLCHNIEYAA